MAAQTLKLVNHHSSQADPGLSPVIPTALVGNSPLLRSGLQHILRESPFALGEAAPVVDSARLQPVASQPILVIIEAKQNASRLVKVTRQVREQFPEARIVVLADQFDLSFVRLGHEAGVDGFCLVASAPDVMIKALELVMLGESVLPSEVLRSIMAGLPQRQQQPLQSTTGEPTLSDLKACKLSAREAQILGCLREGAPNKVIARKLDVTEATIKVHVKAILRKVGAANRTQAAMWASQRLPQQGGASVIG
jgi:two-component system nitrate/nitrite response regulator NarL